MNVNPVEAVWLTINLVSALVTLLNLIDAWADWSAVRTVPVGEPGDSPLEAFLRRARKVQARANVRRELVEFVVVSALIIIVLPALVRPGDTPLSLLLAVFLVVPAGVALNSYLDRRTRRTLAELVDTGRSIEEAGA